MTPAVPCVDCGTDGGHVYAGMKKPGRMDGARFGIPGPLCVACYYRERYRCVIRPRMLNAKASTRTGTR